MSETQSGWGAEDLRNQEGVLSEADLKRIQALEEGQPDVMRDTDHITEAIEQERLERLARLEAEQHLETD